MITQIYSHGLRCVEGLDEEVLQGATWLAQLSGKIPRTAYLHVFNIALLPGKGCP